MLHDARAVANALLSIGDRAELQISPLKLQKLIYFTHGHSWRTRGCGLVFNSFEAWDRGPVIRVVYDEFKDFGYRPIRRRAKWTNFSAGGVEVACASFSAAETECIEASMSIYGRVDAHTLSRLSHAVGGPWDLVRRTPERYPKNLIPKELVASYFIEGFR